MNWFPTALLTALATATGDTILKARFSHLSPDSMAIVKSTAPMPFLLPLLLAISWPETDLVFWQTVGLLVPFEILALLLYMQALKVSPLSLSIPFLAFTPVFIVLTGWLVLDEKVTTGGLLGILCTVTGAYVLHIKSSRKGLLEPFRAIAKEQGSRLMLSVAGIYSLTSVLGKKAIQHSDPIFFACFYFVLLGIVTPLSLGALRWATNGFGSHNKQSTLWSFKKAGRNSWGAWWVVGLAQTIMVLSHMWAIHLITAAYMIAVKRTSLIFSIIYGKLIFKEKEIAQRLAGASLMVLGVGLIVLAG
ncbi:MAG: EamA family transporter [Deltaproteobacteria bacterium]|nr:EamA family transporter [Deltaproteobacteria bacterium]